MTNMEKFADKPLCEAFTAWKQQEGQYATFDAFLGGSSDDAAKKPDKESPVSDIATKLGLAALPLAGLVSGGNLGGKLPSVNVWVFCNS